MFIHTFFTQLFSPATAIKQLPETELKLTPQISKYEKKMNFNLGENNQLNIEIYGEKTLNFWKSLTPRRAVWFNTGKDSDGEDIYTNIRKLPTDQFELELKHHIKSKFIRVFKNFHQNSGQIKSSHATLKLYLHENESDYIDAMMNQEKTLGSDTYHINVFADSLVDYCDSKFDLLISSFSDALSRGLTQKENLRKTLLSKIEKRFSKKSCAAHLSEAAFTKNNLYQDIPIDKSNVRDMFYTKFLDKNLPKETRQVLFEIYETIKNRDKANQNLYKQASSIKDDLRENPNKINQIINENVQQIETTNNEVYEVKIDRVKKTIDIIPKNIKPDFTLKEVYDMLKKENISASDFNIKELINLACQEGLREANRRSSFMSTNINGISEAMSTLACHGHTVPVSDFGDHGFQEKATHQYTPTVVPI